MNGQFVISLDLEKYWGVFDSPNIENYEQNLHAVDTVVERLLTICDAYNVKLTFATVGFLFNKTKEEFALNTPNELPSYTNKRHNSYSKIEDIVGNENSDNIHCGYHLLKKIQANKNHEIGTHTYSHYYCLEEGQTISQFEADLKMAIKVGEDFGVDIKSIVFPRNQINQDYLKVCFNNDITSYRGHEKHTIYDPRPYTESKHPMHRILRILDAYINITGKHTYDLNQLKSEQIVNIPSSNFFRPYNKRLAILEPLKVNRVINGMKKAAAENQLYHLWFHPHNFGKDIDENFQNFEKILKSYTKLNSKYGFESKTMTQLATVLLSNHLE